MTEKDEAGERSQDWLPYDPVDMTEADVKNMIEANERRLKRAWEMIDEYQGKKRARCEDHTMKQVSKQDREHALKQAMLDWDE